MDRTCPQCSAAFEVTADDLEFLERVSPVLAGQKYLIPPPTLCPSCRAQRRLCFRHERGLHRRHCDLTGRAMISSYNANKPYRVYHPEAWWSDDWSALDYGRDYDFSRPFFNQLDDLLHEVPLIGLWLAESQNSDYNTNCFRLKDCYMCANSDFGENYIYGYSVEGSRDVTDCAYLHKCELCYESIDCWDCYHCHFSKELRNCSDCFFSSELSGCKNCFGCHGLRQRQYCIYNEPVDRQQWQEFMQSYPRSWQDIEAAQSKSDALSMTIPKPAVHMLNCEDCLGDHLYNCRDAKFCFDMIDGEHIKYGAYNVMRSQHFADFYAAGEVQWGYEYLGGGLNVSNVAFILNCVNGLNDSYYSILAVNGSHHIFGCIALKKQQYCILNKQYTEAEYNNLVPKIIEHMQSTGEWGEYFPPAISPYGYNEVLAQEKFPLTKEQALSRGFKWADETAKPIDVERTVAANQLPDFITDTPDDILDWAILCAETNQPFRIQKQELAFYRSQGLPVPHLHPDRRHEKRLAKRNPQRLWQRNCAKCQQEMWSSFAPERPEIVYCEDCYLGEVY